MTDNDKARSFAALHAPGRPLVLTNIWDAGSARAVAEAGAPAIATGSWAVARAQGYDDGENLPFDAALTTLRRITATITLPVTFDIETGYARDPATLADNIARVIGAGAIGINIEDQDIGGTGLLEAKEQARRLAAIRARAETEGIALFINARTDVFFKGAKVEDHPRLLPEAIARARAYADAGASGLFVPGLKDTGLIGDLCAATSLPVNVMKLGDAPPVAALAAAGVARISQGPGPYLAAMKLVADMARGALT